MFQSLGATGRGVREAENTQALHNSGEEQSAPEAFKVREG